MFLKNYTSAVAASHTIYRIEQLLIKVGANSIAKDYDATGKMSGLTFEIQLEGNRPMRIKIPADVEGCLSALWADYADGFSLSPDKNEVWGTARKKKKRRDFADQAEKTAWKLMQDWVEVQISMVQLKQADFMQVFLPYAWDGRRSFYQRLKETGFQALLPAPREP